MDNKSKILIVDHVAWVDGRPNHGPGMNVFRELLDSGYACDYFTQDLFGVYPAIKFNREQPTFTHLNDFKVYGKTPPRFKPAAWAYNVWLPTAVLKHEISDYDLVVAVNPLNAMAMYRLRKRIKGKIVYYTADYSEQRFGKSILTGLYNWIDRFAANRADSLWGVSSAICDLRRAQGYTDKNIVHISNAPMLSEFPAPLRSIPVKEHVLLLAYGDIDTPYRYEGLFMSLEELVKHGLNFRMRMVSQERKRHDFFKPVASDQVLERMDFISPSDRSGYIEQLMSATIGLAPYTGEQAWHKYRDSVKIREYFAAGLPTITTPGHSLASDVEINRLGFVAPVPEAFTNHIISLCKDDKLYLEFSSNARTFAMDHDKKCTLLEAVNALTGI